MGKDGEGRGKEQDVGVSERNRAAEVKFIMRSSYAARGDNSPLHCLRAVPWRGPPPRGGWHGEHAALLYNTC